MALYTCTSTRRRRQRRRRWLYTFLILLVIASARIFIRGSNPSSALAGNDNIGISQTQDTALFVPGPAAQLDLPEIPYSASEPNPQTNTLMDDVAACFNAKPPKIIEAREKLNQILLMPIDSQQFAFVKKQLTGLSEKWLFSRIVFPQDELCSHYKVKPGDQLRVIGTKFNIPYEILMEINNIKDPRTLQAGETIKVINGPFHCLIHRSTYTMDLYLQDSFIRSFPIGLGQSDMETPLGRWLVKPTGKLISPAWTDPATGTTHHPQDPSYPLGSRWIGLEGIEGPAKNRTGFAIHGTKNPQEIGTAGSRGCIRLYNNDAIIVYNLLMPGLSQVIVVE